MERNTTRLTVLAAIAAGLVVLAMVADFVIRRPGLVFTLVASVYLLSRPHAPWCYTPDELRRYPSSVVAGLARTVLDFAYVGGLIAGIVYLYRYGFTGVFLLALLVAYVGDRVAAWTIAWWQRRQRRRRVKVESTVAAADAADGTVPVGVNEFGEAVDAEVVR